MTELRWLRDLEMRAAHLRHHLIDMSRQPYAYSQAQLDQALMEVTSIWQTLQANRQAANLAAPPLVRGVPLQESGPAVSTSAVPEGGFDA